MKKISTAISACVILMAFGVCNGADAPVPAGAYDFNTENRPATETALIRPATEDERLYKPSMAAKIFTGPAGIAIMDSIWPADDIYSVKSVGQYKSIRVLPGSYLVKVFCPHGRLGFPYELPVKANSNKTYLIECTGNTGPNAKITLREIEGS